MMREPKLCRYGCGRKIVFDISLPSPPYREIDTAVHHTYKRCAEILGPKSKDAFGKDAVERKMKGRQKT
jgi:hypothetical protein